MCILSECACFLKWWFILLHVVKLNKPSCNDVIKQTVKRLDEINSCLSVCQVECPHSCEFAQIVLFSLLSHCVTHLIFFWHRSIVLQYGKIGNFISPKPLRHRGLKQKGSVMKFVRWVTGVFCRKCHMQWGSVLDLVLEILAWSGVANK